MSAEGAPVTDPIRTAEIDAFAGIEHVVADPLRFKLRLGIGADAYTSLRALKVARDTWEIWGSAATGAGFAASPLVAGTFFASSGWLAAIGLGAAATTPIGWVVAAGAASAGAYYGVTRLVGGYEGSRVDTIPKFINTPIDYLGASLFDFIATVALKVAAHSGPIDDRERAFLGDYFVEEWGLDRAYVDRAVGVVEGGLPNVDLAAVASSLRKFQKDNPDCNPDAMRQELIGFLREIAQADGRTDEREEAAIAMVDAILGSTVAGAIGAGFLAFFHPGQASRMPGRG